MLKNNKIKFTLIGSISLVILAFITSSYTRTDNIQHTGEYFYPELKSKLALINEVELNDSVTNLVLSKNLTTNAWVAKSKANYPINFDKLKSLLVGIADLKIIEAKTNNPDNFTSLSLNQIRGDEISGAIKIAIKVDSEDQPIVDLLLGKRSGVHLRDNYLDEIYVRRNSESQVWLVSGKLPTAFNFANLVTQPLFNILAADIQELSMQHPKQKKLILYKDKKEDLDYKIAGLAKQQKIKAQYLTNIIPATVANLTFEDVREAKADKTNWRDCSIINFKTFNKLEVELKVQQQKDLVIIKIARVTNLDQGHQFNLQDWNYVFQMQDVENLFKTAADLI